MMSFISFTWRRIYCKYVHGKNLKHPPLHSPLHHGRHIFLYLHRLPLFAFGRHPFQCSVIKMAGAIFWVWCFEDVVGTREFAPPGFLAFLYICLDANEKLSISPSRTSIRVFAFLNHWSDLNQIWWNGSVRLQDSPVLILSQVGYTILNFISREKIHYAFFYLHLCKECFVHNFA